MALRDLIESDLSSVFFNTSDFAVSATVSRRAVTVTLPVILDMQESRSTDREGVMVSRNHVVAIVQTSTYSFGDGATTPSVMDQFVIDSRRYLVHQPDGKQSHWEYTDATSEMMKIYLEEVNNNGNA